jgi:hypothetical protein
MNLDESILDLAKSICEEYCCDTLTDSDNFSILSHIPKGYYPAICTRLSQIDFVEIFRHKTDKHIVALFQLMFEDMGEYIVEEDEDSEDDNGLTF